MGIPGFFSFLKKYNNVSNDDLDDNFIKANIVAQDENIYDFNYHFFLDFNGAIYTAFYSKDNILTEESLIIHTIHYLDSLVSIYKDYPLKTLFIAIDGVPPRAKIQQQRMRRFHNYKEKKIIKKIEEQYGDSSNSLDKNDKKDEKINTNIITPGTTFMNKLKLAIQKHLKTSPIYKNISKIIFSAADVPGEGEHKIMSYLNSPDNIFCENDKTIIYGLDADLIMLSMASNLNNIYLLREKTLFGSYTFDIDGHEFLYLDVDILKTCLIDEFTNYITDITHEYIPRLIDDYIFLTFLIGNDFIPKIPHLSVYNNGIETLLKTYCRLFNHHRIFIVDRMNMKINEIMFLYLFTELAQIENKSMVTYSNRRQHKRINMRHIETEEDRQKQLLKMLPLQYLNIEKIIEPKRADWRHRYYQICLNCKYNTNTRDLVVKQYMESIVWTFHYYFNQLTSWDWFYQFQYGPTCLDILNYLKDYTPIRSIRKHVTFNINNIKKSFKLGQPIKPQELLIMVLPLENKSIMINNIDTLLNKNPQIKKYFPSNYNIAIPYHTMYWECHPILPIIDIDVIKKTIKKIYLTNDEKERNKIGTNFIIKI